MADWVWPAGLGVLGAIVGSFLATLVIRWPQGRSVAGRAIGVRRVRADAACVGIGAAGERVSRTGQVPDLRRERSIRGIGRSNWAARRWA